MELLHRATLKKGYLLSLIFCGVLASACSAPSSEEQDKNWTDPADLVSTSDRILVAGYADSALETVALVDSITGEISGEIDVLFRQFEVFDTLKGTSDSGDLIWIAFEPGQDGELVNGEGTVQEFVNSETYVLFLKGRLRPIEYPADYGAVLWTGNGEPSFAELIGDRLEFWSERPYLSLLEQNGRALPEELSAAPFTLTLEEIRTIDG